jgi:hypothetical protein
MIQMIQKTKEKEAEKEGSERRTLSVTRATKERLAKHGRIDQSYDDLINTLLDFYEANQGQGQRK